MKAPVSSLLALGALLVALPVATHAQNSPAKGSVLDGIPAANNFAFDLFRQMAATPGDCVIAPDGVRQAFGLIGAGAQGETRAELDKVLGVSSDEAKRAKELLDIQSIFATNRAVGKIDLRSDNALWLSAKFPVKPEFRTASRTTYRAFIAPTDFSDSKSAVNQINGWVASKAGGQLTNVYKPESISPDTALMVTNVSKYKLNWEEAFDAEKNLKHTFNSANGSTTQVEFLFNGKLGVWYSENAMFQAVAVPYAGKKIEMMIILPREKVSLAEIISKFTGDVFTQVRTAPMKYQGREVDSFEVSFAMPKFKFSKETELVSTLKKIGVQKLFNPAEANLEGISDVKPLWVYQASQIFEIEVDEKGTVAAAVTKAEVPFGGSPKMGKANFGANRPFMFVIREVSSGLILCLGKVEDAKGMTAAKN